MRQIDLTDRLPKHKGARVCYHTVYACPPFYGFLDNGIMGTGISFVRSNKTGGLRSHKNGSPRWYHGSSNTLAKARTTVRRDYGISVPQEGWERVKVKTWSHSHVVEIIENLKTEIS